MPVEAGGHGRSVHEVKRWTPYQAALFLLPEEAIKNRVGRFSSIKEAVAYWREIHGKAAK